MTDHWFDSASFGMFIHWGIASVHGDIDLSWGMIEDKPWDAEERSIPPSDYFALAESFRPEAYEPDAWLAAARRAGMEYAVLTTRHHDGFALWPSDHGTFNTGEYLDGRDLVGEFVDACRRQGVKVGFYYSGPDWHHPAHPIEPGPYEELFPTADSVDPADPAAIADFEEYFAYAKGQIRELVTRYGEIDVFWFDGSVTYGPFDRGMAELYQLIRSAQPDVLINDRGDPTLGDYQTPECRLPDRPLDGRWERCQTWGTPWGYVDDAEYADLDWTVAELAKTVARGGNLLLNVGPGPTGELPDSAHERLDELADWMDANRPAIVDVDAGPWPPRSTVPITRTDGIWYLHVLADHDPEVLVKNVPAPGDVRRIRDGHALEYAYDGANLYVEVPDETRASPNEVIAVSWDHPDQQDGDRIQTRPD